MADMTALQRIIGGQVRAHEALRREDEALRREDEAHRRRRAQYVDNAFLRAGIDPETVPPEQLDTRFQEVLSMLTQPTGASKRQALIERAAIDSNIDPATIVDGESFLTNYFLGKRAESEQARQTSLASSDLGNLSQIEGPEASGRRADAMQILTGIRQDPKDRPPPSHPSEALNPYMDRGIIENALQSVGFSLEDILDNRSAMYNDQHRPRTEQLLSDWILSQDGVAGEDWADKNLGLTLARQLIEQMKPGQEPLFWEEVFSLGAAKAPPPQPLYNPYGNEGPRPVSTGGPSIYKRDHDTPANANLTRPDGLELLTQSTKKEVRDISSIVTKVAGGPGMQAVMLGLAEVESSMGKNLVNVDGSSARGVFQIMPETFRRVASREGSVLAPYKDYSEEKIKELLVDRSDVNAVAARELFDMNRQSLPNPSNVWAAIASHHLGIKEILRLYGLHGLDINRDDPIRLVAALKDSKDSRHQEFVKWYPKVVENISHYRTQLEGTAQ